MRVVPGLEPNVEKVVSDAAASLRFAPVRAGSRRIAAGQIGSLTRTPSSGEVLKNQKLAYQYRNIVTTQRKNIYIGRSIFRLWLAPAGSGWLWLALAGSSHGGGGRGPEPGL